MTAELYLSRGFVALVDSDDLPWITAMGKWSAHVQYTAGGIEKVYAVGQKVIDGRRRFVYLHRLVAARALDMTLAELSGTGWYVDHMNGSHDNRKRYLRLTTPTGNFLTAHGRIEKKSSYRGVTFCANRSHLDTPWKAQIYNVGDDHKEHLGYYDCEIKAAEAYDARAVELYGAQAYPNFPHELCKIITLDDVANGHAPVDEDIPF